MDFLALDFFLNIHGILFPLSDTMIYSHSMHIFRSLCKFVLKTVSQ